VRLQLVSVQAMMMARIVFILGLGLLLDGLRFR
jgi:hypothetical protein